MPSTQKMTSCCESFCRNCSPYSAAPVVAAVSSRWWKSAAAGPTHAASVPLHCSRRARKRRREGSVASRTLAICCAHPSQSPLHTSCDARKLAFPSSTIALLHPAWVRVGVRGEGGSAFPSSTTALLHPAVRVRVRATATARVVLKVPQSRATAQESPQRSRRCSACTWRQGAIRDVKATSGVSSGHWAHPPELMPRPS